MCALMKLLLTDSRAQPTALTDVRTCVHVNQEQVRREDLDGDWQPDHDLQAAALIRAPPAETKEGGCDVASKMAKQGGGSCYPSRDVRTQKPGANMQSIFKSVLQLNFWYAKN
jgi:hypothetical protein